MARPSFTDRLRDELLRQDRAENGVPDEPAPTHREGPEGGYTGRLARESRAEHDNQEHDEKWLRANGGTYQGPLTWGAS
jgi:hypothetical protein